MNDGGYVSRNGIAAGVLWTLVAGLLMAAWAVVLWTEGHEFVAGMLAATGCATSALAATMQIKTYACRLSRLVRMTAGAREEVDTGLRPLR